MNEICQLSCNSKHSGNPNSVGNSIILRASQKIQAIQNILGDLKILMLMLMMMTMMFTAISRVLDTTSPFSFTNVVRKLRRMSEKC